MNDDADITSIDLRPRRILAVLCVFALILGGMAGAACAHDPDPMVALYGSEGLRCVYEASSRAEARECFKQVDALYSQDGGK